MELNKNWSETNRAPKVSACLVGSLALASFLLVGCGASERSSQPPTPSQCNEQAIKLATNALENLKMAPQIVGTAIARECKFTHVRGRDYAVTRFSVDTDVRVEKCAITFNVNSKSGTNASFIPRDVNNVPIGNKAPQPNTKVPKRDISGEEYITLVVLNSDGNGKVELAKCAPRTVADLKSLLITPSPTPAA